MADENAGFPSVGPLYMKTTTPRSEGGVTLSSGMDILGNLSISSQFKVALHLGNSSVSDSDLNSWLIKSNVTTDSAMNTYYDFYCAEVVIPGATFDVAEELGGRQGTIERVPIRRIFAPVQMTFYVDNDYKILRLLEEWMNYINPLQSSAGEVGASGIGFGDNKESNNFYRMRYPNSYKRIISIVKFERNFRSNPSEGGDNLQSVPTITYRLIDAFPTNITAIPLSYDGSTITKVSVEFSYTRYVYEKHGGNVNNLPTGPGDTSGITNPSGNFTGTFEDIFNAVNTLSSTITNITNLF
jgi:hypothetical protein